MSQTRSVTFRKRLGNLIWLHKLYLVKIVLVKLLHCVVLFFALNPTVLKSIFYSKNATTWVEKSFYVLGWDNAMYYLTSKT